MPRKPSANGAHASIGGVLYIRTRNTRLLERPDANARVLALLQPPAQVIWLGSHETDRRWQRVRYGVHTGVLLRANLAIAKPDGNVKGRAVGPCPSCKGGGRVDVPRLLPVLPGPEVPGTLCAVCWGTGLDPNDPAWPRASGVDVGPARA
jgi:hypothetical protein